MWNINIKEFKKVEDGMRMQFTCEFSKDGVNYPPMTFVESSKRALENRLNAITNQLDAIESFESELTTGPYTFSEKVEQTKEEIDQRVYEFKKLELARLKAEVELGLVSEGEYQAKLVEVIEAKPAEVEKPL